MSNGAADARWAAAVLAGIAQSVSVYLWAALWGLQVSDFSAFLGDIFAADARTSAVWIGRVLIALMALVWGALYPAIRSSLPGQPIQRGLIYGALVWLVTSGGLIPLLGAIGGAATASPGPFALGFGGWPATLNTLLAHLVYGLVLATYFEVRTPLRT